MRSSDPAPARQVARRVGAGTALPSAGNFELLAGGREVHARYPEWLFPIPAIEPTPDKFQYNSPRRRGRPPPAGHPLHADLAGSAPRRPDLGIWELQGKERYSRSRGRPGRDRTPRRPGPRLTPRLSKATPESPETPETSSRRSPATTTVGQNAFVTPFVHQSNRNMYRGGKRLGAYPAQLLDFHGDAETGTRTRTLLRAGDFKSPVSTNSTIPARVVVSREP